MFQPIRELIVVPVAQAITHYLRNEMKIELKIKAKTLATESKYIRREELKMRNAARWERRNADDEPSIAAAMRLHSKWHSLHTHRLDVVRREARLTHLVRGFVAGKPYKALERSVRWQNRIRDHDIDRMVKMLVRFGLGGGDNTVKSLTHQMKKWIENGAT